MNSPDLPFRHPGLGRPPEAFLPAPLPAGSFQPPLGLTFGMLASGQAPLVYLPEGGREKPSVTQALQSMLTRHPAEGLANPDAWEDLLAAAGIGAKVYVVDRRNEQWQVINVRFDPGGRTGQLQVRHLGRLSRSGDRLIDLQEAFSYMIPVVVYRSGRSLRQNPPLGPGRAFFGRAREPVQVIAEAWPGDPGYWDVSFVGDADVVTVPAHDLYTQGGDRWVTPTAPARKVWTNPCPVCVGAVAASAYAAWKGRPGVRSDR